jgi:hypothetical protein
MNIRKIKLLFGLSIAALFFLCNWKVVGPVYQGDEGGYLANASFLSGNSLDAGSSYHAGYSFFLVPAFWISSDPLVVFMIVKMINSILWGFSGILVIGILQFIFPNINISQVILAALVALLYPAWISFSGYAFSENASILFYLLSIYLAFRVLRKGSCWWLFWAMSLGYSFFIHPKSAPVTAAALVSALLITKARRDWFWFIAFFLIVMSMTLCYWFIIQPTLVNGMTTGDFPPLLHYRAPMQLLTDIDSLAGIGEFVTKIIGQFFYINLASLGLVIIPFIEGVKKCCQYIREREKSWITLIFRDDFPVYIFIAGSFFGTLVIAAMSLEGAPRFDQWMYGRYVEGVALPFMAIGFVLLSKKRILLSMLILMISVLILFFSIPSKLGYYVNINGLGLWQPQTITSLIVDNAPVTILVWTIPGIICLLFLAMFKEQRYRVYLIALVFTFTIAIQITVHNLRMRGYVFPKNMLHEYVSEQYPPGSCIGLDGDGSELKDYFYAYAFYFQDFQFIRFNPVNWHSQCNGPLISIHTDIDENIPDARAIIYNYADNFILWEKKNENQANCLPGECVRIILKDYPYKQVGENYAGGIRTNGKAGYLITGPYISMKAGKYVLEIDGNITEHSGQIRIDVASNGGNHVFASFSEADLINQLGSTLLLQKKISLDQDTEDLVIQVWVDATADVELHGYIFQKDD